MLLLSLIEGMASGLAAKIASEILACFLSVAEKGLNQWEKTLHV